jgi:hypothetical protein
MVNRECTYQDYENFLNIENTIKCTFCTIHHQVGYEQGFSADSYGKDTM